MGSGAELFDVRGACYGQGMGDPSSTHVALETEPNPEDVRRLDERLYAFNVQTTGITDGKLLASFLRDKDGAVVGGIYGWTWGATCYVRYLFVPAEMRKQGHGSSLMHAVETEAKARGCGRSCCRRTTFRPPNFTAGSASR